jgi:8-oxo-dGTP pyrophosphatase MutT (NUDIX family)
MTHYSVNIEPPEDFHPAIYVSGCYCACQGKLLFLKRHPERPQGGTWGVPAGKMEKGETPRMTVVREVFEEVGLQIDTPDLQDLGPLYCRLHHLDYVFHVFYKQFEESPHIHLAEDEHLESAWATPQEAYQLPLIVGGKEALDYFRQRSNF